MERDLEDFEVARVVATLGTNHFRKEEQINKINLYDKTRFTLEDFGLARRIQLEILESLC